IGATVVRRTPLRLLFPPLRWQRRHYLLDERPDEPSLADTMLGAFLMLRRTLLDQIGRWDPGFRMYCEDIDLHYRAAKAGWERSLPAGAGRGGARRERGERPRPARPRRRRRPCRPQRVRAPAARGRDEARPGDLSRPRPTCPARADRRLHRQEARLRREPSAV